MFGLRKALANSLAALSTSSFFAFKSLVVVDKTDNFSFDSSLMGIISQDLNEFGYDLFLNVTKTHSSGFTYGVSTSTERYEAEESQTFSKNGNEMTFTIPVVRQGSFISMFVGWTF